jgi:hypothetical protein
MWGYQMEARHASDSKVTLTCWSDWIAKSSPCVKQFEALLRAILKKLF